MNGIQDLNTSLLDLLHRLNGTEVNLIIGGGFGIYLKAEYVRTNEIRRLLEEMPEARSTNDLDLFLRPELLINAEKLKPLAEAINALGYKVVPGAEKYQFIKHGPGVNRQRDIKIDILTGPQGSFQDTPVKTDDRRARPKPSVGIHAHPIDEAITLEEGLLSIPLEGNLSSGKQYQDKVFLPHPYTFLMMKLFAFRDRFTDESKDYGIYHALDLYTILATTTEKEWKSALQLSRQYRTHPHGLEACDLVAEYFFDPDRIGIIRLKESPYYRSELQIENFISALQELFPINPKTDSEGR